MPSQPRAVILGGTGAIGGATAVRLADRGWTVDVTGRDPLAMPTELIERGVRFYPIDRSDTPGIASLIGVGAELIVDLVAYTAAGVRTLLPVMRACDSIVIASSRAVYVDSEGRHINGEEPPQFQIPILESNPTLARAPEGTDPFTREGYASSKVAVEQAALYSGLPITVIRPSKVHGRWARNPRTRSFVEAILSGVRVIDLADRGESVDHLTAADNVAALIETVARKPGTRVLNAADPDPLTAAEIVTAIGAALGWGGRVNLLEPGREGGEHPWHAVHPIVLDMQAARALGYRPVASGEELLGVEASWIAAQSNRGAALA